MAVWRMNEIWRRMTLALVFYTLLFLSCQGQDDTQMTPTTSALGGDTNTQSTPLPEGSTGNSATSGSFDHAGSAPSVIPLTTQDSATTNSDVLTANTQKHQNGSMVNEKNVDKPTETVTEIQVLMETKGRENSEKQNRNQTDASTVEADRATPDGATPNRATPAVLISLLLTGLAVAAGLIAWYMMKNHCRTNAKGMKLADESHVSDEENQGNTLVSVAPLTPPEAQEKPSQNGESGEAVKTQAPPAATNGHSAKTADTEL